MLAKKTYIALVAVIIPVFILAAVTILSAKQTDANTTSLKARLESIMSMAGEPDSLPKVGLTLNCINGSKLQLSRGKKTIFMLLWNTDDPNSAEFRAFGNLFFAGFDNPKAQFLAINLDPLSKKKKVVAELLKNPSLSAQVIAAASGNKVLRKFRTLKIETATLAIITPAGKVQYLGNGRVLEPQEILKQLLPKAQKPVPILYRKERIEVSEEEFNPQAEKQLEHARIFFRIGNKMLAGKSYGQPIRMCRRVIRDYPDTKYADEARLLLRKVPERYRRRFKITDEELGL